MKSAAVLPCLGAAMKPCCCDAVFGFIGFVELLEFVGFNESDAVLL